MFSAIFCFFFFNDTATTEIYTLSLHDALPILIVQLHRAQECLLYSSLPGGICGAQQLSCSLQRCFAGSEIQHHPMEVDGAGVGLPAAARATACALDLAVCLSGV